jgi:hypothetical protein
MGTSEVWLSYDTGEDSDSLANNDNLLYQTFTTPDTYPTQPDGIYLKVYRVGTLTTATISIRECNDDGTPYPVSVFEETGVDVSGVTTDSAGEWVKFTTGSFPILLMNKTYALCLDVDTTGTDGLKWLKDTDVTSLSGYSDDSGITWTAEDSQTFLYEIYYDPSQQTQGQVGPAAYSKSINLNNGTITKATLTATIVSGTNFEYFLSPDGGVNWEQVTNGVEYTFTNSGNDLRWRIWDSAGTGGEISKVVVSYS